MAKKSGLIQRQRASEDAMYNAGNRVGLQKMTDFFIIALNDPDVMGKGVLGYDRLRKLLDAVEVLQEKYKDAFDPRKKEADVAQDKIDERIKKIVGDRPFMPFEERYPELKKCKY